MYKSIYFLVFGAALTAAALLLNRAVKADKHLRRVKNRKADIQEWENEGGSPAVSRASKEKSS